MERIRIRSTEQVNDTSSSEISDFIAFDKQLQQMAQRTQTMQNTVANDELAIYDKSTLSSLCMQSIYCAFYVFLYFQHIWGE